MTRSVNPLILSDKEKMDKAGFVYILELDHACWYVGWSQDIQVRVASHFIGIGAKCTQLHKPISVHSVRPGDKHLETLTTIALMATHGWEKVRGGSYCIVDMPKPPASIAKAMHYASYRKTAPEPANPDEQGQ